MTDSFRTHSRVRVLERVEYVRQQIRLALQHIHSILGVFNQLLHGR